jgi:hypothetical protein
MSYVILKQLLPSLEGTQDYNEDMNYITKCVCIDNDELFIFNTLVEAENKKTELLNDERYNGRKLKIIEI